MPVKRISITQLQTRGIPLVRNYISPILTRKERGNGRQTKPSSRTRTQSTDR